MDTEEISQVRGAKVIDLNGDKIGKVEEIYLDKDTDKPEWVLVNTGLFGSSSTFVPLQGSTRQGDDLQVSFDKDQVKDAPGVDAGKELSQSDEAELYRYYGLDYGEESSDSGLPEGGTGTGLSDTTGSDATTGDVQDRSMSDMNADAGYSDRPLGTADVDRDDSGRDYDAGTTGRDTSGPTTDDAVTRSEEELHVGTREQETGKVRLRKHIVTENVTQTVPVQREEVSIEREPITDANVGDATSGPAISEEEHEMTLSEEVPVVEKQAVPKERIRLDKDVTTDEAQVSEDVRREEIDVDDSQRDDSQR
ncbi:MAG: PRC and DUF2382 domain-containing protein [Actinomycetota bacterium]|nr:PRC and DUF2382 domain-containing protein [Actinomycetota bacterium]